VIDCGRASPTAIVEQVSWVIAVIVVEDASRSVLVDPTETGDGSGIAHLPIVEVPSGEPKADQISDAIERLLDRPITPIWMQYEESDETLQNGVGALLTIADPGRDARAGRSFKSAEGVVQTLEPKMARAQISAWLDRLAGRADPRTPPWMHPGWFERVSRWIAERMTAAGMPPTGPSRMTYQSPIGTVLRTRSRERDVYLKCPAPHFRAEASITRALAARTPGWVPTSSTSNRPRAGCSWPIWAIASWAGSRRRPGPMGFAGSARSSVRGWAMSTSSSTQAPNAAHSRG
jgi:hypothetical protein